MFAVRQRISEGVNCRNHRAGVVRIDIGMNTVTEVEHMPGTSPETRQHRGDPFANLFGGRIQTARIEITLQRYLGTDPGTSFGEIGRPVQP